MADFGQFGPGSDRRNLAQKGQVGAKMVQVERQDDHLEAIWEAILRSLGGLGGDLSKNSRSVKNERPYSVLASFWTLGRSSWRVLGSILGDLGDKLESLGPSWRQIGIFLARCWN